MEKAIVSNRLSYMMKDFHQYLLVISPDETVTQAVHKAKIDFYERFGIMQAIKSKPHITIGNFVMKDYAEAVLLKWIQRVCMYTPAMDIRLNGFNGFKPHTLYVNVEECTELRQLLKQLKALEPAIKQSITPAAHFGNNPHLTVCRGLKENVYEKALSYYQPKTFKGGFIANSMVLLKRKDEWEPFKMANVFTFNGLPPQPQQLSLGLH